MVLGLVIILLACVLNVMLLASPLVLLVWFAAWATDLMMKLHWIGPRGADVVYLAILVFTILMAACIQLWVWGLAPRAYGGLFQTPSHSSLSFGIWTEYEAWRLLLVPQLRLVSERIDFSLSHVVLWRQGWMTEHGDDDFGWADLSTNYQWHVADGGTYWEVAASWKQGRRFWFKSRLGIGFDESVGETVAASERFNSYYHFKVGDRCLRPGMPLGHDFGLAQRTIDRLVQHWGRLGQRMRSHPQRPPDARLHDLVRQKEE